MALRLYELAGARDDRRFSPYCWRARLALAHKGLEFESVPWRFQEKAAIAFSGQGKVPVLADGDRTVVDSWQIACYLEDEYAERPSLFGSPEAKAHALFVKHWDEKTLFPPVLPLVLLDVFKCLHEGDRAYFRQTRESLLGTTLEAFAGAGEASPQGNRDAKLSAFRATIAPLQETLQHQPFLAGDRPNFSDYIVFARFQFARVTSPAPLLEPGDPVYAWRERMLDLFDGLARKVPHF